MEDRERVPRWVSITHPRSPVPVPDQHLLQAGGVIHLTQQGGEFLLEDGDGELRDPLLLGGVSLGFTKEAAHIDVYILEVVG